MSLCLPGLIVMQMQVVVVMGEEKNETGSIVSGRFKWEADRIKGEKGIK